VAERDDPIYSDKSWSISFGNPFSRQQKSEDGDSTPTDSNEASDVSCPFCLDYRDPDAVSCEHLVAEGDPESVMVYHWSQLKELMELLESAHDSDHDLASLGVGIHRWEQPLQRDPEDLLTGDFLREIPGFITRSRTVQAAMSESTYFWIFVSPDLRGEMEQDIKMLIGQASGVSMRAVWCIG
jgi:hypothetical protein